MVRKKVFWKDICKSFSASKGRFLSIMLLMLLGSLVLTGLKVTPQDMQRTADHYLNTHKTMDLSVIASAGFSKEDQKELDHIKGGHVEYGYMSDVTIKDTEDAVRLFSNSKDISTYGVVSGKLPRKPSEIALSSKSRNKYKIGQSITFSQGENDHLKKNTYKIVGFVTSADIWSKKYLGSSTAGDGNLYAYGIVAPGAFDSSVYSIARLRYDNLRHFKPFSNDYNEQLVKNQEKLDDLLADNGKVRKKELQSSLQKTLDSGRRQISSVKAQLQEQTYPISENSGYQAAAAQQQLKQAQTQVTQKEAKLDDLQVQINHLETPTYNTYTRSTLSGGEGYSTYRSSSKTLNNIGNLFPVVLYLVAALVTFTTMTRFVNEERINSGILKALGYSNRDVIKKFVIYGFVSSLVGTVLGVLGGHYLLPGIVAKNSVTTTNIGSLREYFYWSYALLVVFLAFISAVLPAFLVTRRELNEKPAQLLLPKPPMRGSRILLERLGFIWRNLSFTQKVTARNIFRYKQRMLMTIFGVAGSVALLFTGLGIQSSLGKIVDNQFKQLTTYDLQVSGSNHFEKDQEVADFLKSDAVSNYQNIYSHSVDEKIAGQSEKKAVSILVSDKNNFGSFIHLRSADTKIKVSLSDEGAVISEKLAQFYHVKKGDTFHFKENDKTYDIKVSDVVDMNVNHYIFMSDSYYHKVFDKTATNNTVLVHLKNGSTKNISKQATKLLAMDDVLAVTQNSSLINQVNTAVRGLSASVTTLAVISVLLAVVILYNLTSINVVERIRELSTIKVLGFHNKEVTLYIYRETIILSLIGIVLGLVSGYYLHRMIINIMSQDNRYPTAVDYDVYVIPVVAIVLILVFLGWLVNRRLKGVDMLEALKSVD
ncbi:ABC transporter permease [Streptococcus mutans]|uniref:ABC transporter permease n=1 Tax=Streptococcus mutans TaxID=1309 RepID=UPI0009F65CD4|nr:ABC transporter permease [Streptococcus mutans]PNM00476.1 ABC transporter permease [Streptococcus mutans]